MTIPISPVNIGTTGVVKQPSVLEQIAPILEALSQQKLAKAQIANLQSLAEERKLAAAKAARELQDQADAAAAFYQHLSGAAVRVKPEKPSADGTPSHQGVDNTNGTLIPLPQFEKGLAPGALVHYQGLIQDYNKSVVQSQDVAASQAQQQHTQFQDTITQAGLDEDRRISGVLSRFAGRQWNRSTINRTIGEVLTINPQKAQQVATTINSLLPDYQVVVNDNGTVSYVSKQPEGGVAGAPVQPKRPTDEMNKLGEYARRVLEGNATMTDLENKQPGIGQRVDDRLRALRSIEQIPVAGRAAATVLTPQFLRGLSSDERRYVNARIDLANAFLRRASGAQINMEELDRETTPYVPTFRQPEDVIPSIQQRRLQAGLSFAEQAQNGFDPNRLSPAARRYLLQGIAPHPGYTPGNPYTQPQQ